MKMVRLGLSVAMLLCGGMAIGPRYGRGLQPCLFIEREVQRKQGILLQCHADVDRRYTSVLVCAQYTGRTYICIGEC